MKQRTTIYRIEAATPAELEDKVPNISILPGSRGRVEVYADRVGSICPIPLGPLMVLPVAGTTWAEALAPAGAVVTDRGLLGICDAFVDFNFPVTQGQGPVAAMSAVTAAFLAIRIGVAIAALVTIGWVISKIVLLLEALVDIFGPQTTAILLLAGAGLVAWGFLRGRRRG